MPSLRQPLRRKEALKYITPII
jgi:small subunit ribosomal protein S25e